MPTTRQRYQRFIRCGSAKPVVIPIQDLVGQLSLLQPLRCPRIIAGLVSHPFHDQSGGKRAITLSRKDWRFGTNRASLSRHVEGRWPFSDPAPPACRHCGASVVTAQDAATNRRRIPTMSANKLTDTQLVLLSAPHSTRRVRLNSRPISRAAPPKRPSASFCATG